jgi:asparagine synthetase B (glutamine-hydrolysing)
VDGWLIRVDFARRTFEAKTGASAARWSSAELECIVAADRAADLAADLSQEAVSSSPNGVAAAARWDRTTNLLTLFRDRTGLHPLFYATPGELVVAATDLRALVTEVGASPAPESISAWLDRQPLDPSTTLFEGIRRVPAGHVLELGRNEARLRRDWTPSSPGRRPRSAAREFGTMLERAVLRLVDGERAAVFLSGGLDSAAVLAAAATSGEPLALCVDFEGASESATQHAVAAALGASRLDRAAGPSGQLVRRALDIARESLWPTPAVWSPPFEDLTHAARAAGASVLLDGLGGDELLDAGYAAGRALVARPWWLPFWLQAERRYTGSARRSLKALAERGRVGFAEDRRHDLTDPNLSMQREETFDRGTRTGLRRRHPLWDADVVDLLHGLPAEALVARGQPKAPARAYLRRRVPAIQGAWPRPKVANVLATAVHSELDRLLATAGTPRLAGLGIMDRDIPVDGLRFDRTWRMLCLENWLAGVEDWGERR